MTNKTIQELPPFTPQLIDFRLDEFHEQSLKLLKFPIIHDQSTLDMAPFQLDTPAPPPDPPLPLLPHMWYPKPIKEVRDWSLGKVMPSRPEDFVGKVRNSQANDLMRPLLASEGPVQIRGELGMGKTTMLQYIATHEKTTRRYRRVWYVDDPQHLIQTLALVLNVPQVLSTASLTGQLELLKEAFDDNTLLLIDNLTAIEAEQFKGLTKHLVMAIEAEPELDENGDPIPDPENVVTLHPLPRTDAQDFMAFACGITDPKLLRGQMRAWLGQLAKLLNGHPLAMMITGALFREDGLPMEQLVEMMADRIAPENPKPFLAIDLSLDALPSDYMKILEAMSALPQNGACIDAILATANIRNHLSGYRGLAFLAKRGFIHRDERPGEHYVAHPIIWQKVGAQDVHTTNNDMGKRLRNWVLTTARRHSETAEEIYRYQDEIVHTLNQAKKHHIDDVVHKLNMTLGSYFREYALQHLSEDMPTPRLMGKRAEVAKMAQDTLDFVKMGEIEKAEQIITDAITKAETYSSPHEIAETMVVSAQIADIKGLYRKASKLLENAAKLVFELNNEQSLHVLRIGLAMLYRKQQRYNDALGVLDDEPDTFSEKARIYRASEQWDLMLEALDNAGNFSPRERAESLLLAGLYADALEAISNQNDSATAQLRAKIYHLQDDLDNAIRGYQLAIDALPNESTEAQQARLAMGIAYGAQSEFSEAEKLFNEVLRIENQRKRTNHYLKGKAWTLLASLNYIDQNPNEAIRLSEKAIDALNKALEDNAPQDCHRVLADAYRTLARSHARLGRTKQLVDAYQGEVDHSQSVPHRDEYRIGLALHHLADAYGINDELDRAIANYRLALTHQDIEEHPESYFITLLALHHALHDAERYEDALEITQMAIKHLDSNPPADLQQMGYVLCRHAFTYKTIERHHEYERYLGRWMTLLAGRSDALRDEDRPMIRLLALSLATRSLLASNRSEEALPLAEYALNLAEHYYPSTEVMWSARRDVGETLLQEEDWAGCIEMLTPLFYDDVTLDDHVFSFAQSQIGFAYHNQEELQKSIEHYRKAFERQPVEHRQALILEDIAHIQLELRDTESAIETLNEAIEIIDPEVHTGDAARINTFLAQLYGGSNRFAEAVKIYEAALTMLRNLPDTDPIHMAKVYQSLGESNEAQGQYPQAAIAYRNALDTLESTRTPAHDDHREILIQLADVKIVMEHHDEAILLYQQARDETEHYGTELELGQVTAKLADLYRDTNQLDDAIYYYEQALEFQPSSEVPRERAQTLRGYGRSLALTQQFEDARSAWNQALKITTDAPPLEIALTHRAIGQAYRAQQMWDEALEAFEEALKFHEANTDEIAHTLRLYGNTLIEAKMNSESIQPLTTALDIEEGLPQQVSVRIVKTLDLLAYAQEQVGDISGAIASFHKAMVYLDKTHQPIQIANRLRSLGRLYTVLEKWREAHKALEDSLEVEFGYQPRSDARIPQTLEMIAVAYRREGQLELAAEAYKRMASYANLTKTAEADLKNTMDKLEKYRATLDAAHQSLSLMERTQPELRDAVYVYALIAETQANLANVKASNEAIDSLLTMLENSADQLSIADSRPDYRALAHVFEGSQAASQGDLTSARAHFQMALHDTHHMSMKWVIQRGLDSVRE